MPTYIGRLAPSPSGRMHLGNAFAALLAWLAARSAGGRLLLRLEDLDIDRCKRDYGLTLIDDLCWLGLCWDGDPIWQTERLAHYDAAFAWLTEMGLVYPCWCSRAERLAASAPHRGEAEPTHHNACRAGCHAKEFAVGRQPAWMIRVPETVGCEDFIIRRSDGVYAYQLAVVADDGAMGVTEVVRGADLRDVTPRQVWLHTMLGYAPPRYLHVPLLIAPDGRRLSKRDRDLDFGALRARYTPEELVGLLGFWAGLTERPAPILPRDLCARFDRARLRTSDIIVEEGRSIEWTINT